MAGQQPIRVLEGVDSLADPLLETGGGNLGGG
jgi:hypothetical protein